jgi:hypothetical protein
LQAMWPGTSTSRMWGDSLSKTCAVSGQRKVSQTRGTCSNLDFDNVCTTVSSQSNYRNLTYIYRFTGGVAAISF